MSTDEAHDPAAIRFGTSGWRGVLGDGVTYPALRRLARATSAWMLERSDARRVLVGYDTRFASADMARVVSDVAAEAGLEPVLTAGVVPTPVLSRAVRRRRVAGGLMLTASHNPPAYHGLKVFDAEGGSIPDEDARRIEDRLAEASTSEAPSHAVRRAELIGGYVRDVARVLDGATLASTRPGVVYDAMHGAGAAVLDGLLGRLGCRVQRLRAEPDPRFGGGAPDPVPARLGGLVAQLGRRRGRWIGLATDGDADRVAVVLPGGRLLSETEVLALLVDHLARTGRVRRGVAISRATGSLVERVARDHGLRVARHGIGFKHLARALARGDADVAGEESGGFAWGRMGIDKDGMLAGALLCELAATGRGGVLARLEDLEARHGATACGRRALALDAARARGLDVLCVRPPERVGRVAVREVNTDDGLHLALDDGFVMWRRSGTEPVLRLYGEARSPRKLARRLDEAGRLLASAAGLPARR